jgi:Holliday junction DNA helicase RuvB
LRDRFGIISHLDFYDETQLREIVRRSARILGVGVEAEGLTAIASRSRGTPRVANRLLRRVRDYAEIRADGVITGDVAREALRMMEVDELGLDRTDQRLILTIIDKFGGGPVGVETLAASISEEVETIEDVYEPFLMQLGYLARTPRGRVVTPAAYAHFKRSVPSQGSPDQGRLFMG